MRLNIRYKFGNWTFFSMLSHTQTLEGITSKVGDNKHLIFWDLENTTIENAQKVLTNVQEKYILSNIYILSDIEGSYRAICFTEVDFKDLMKILLDTEYLDYNFFYWTVQRGKATIRLGNKKNRKSNKIIDVLESYYIPFPTKLEHTIYDTGFDKMGRLIINAKLFEKDN